MDSYDNFDLIGDDNLMQDAFKFGELDADPGCCFSTRDGDWDPFSASGSGTHTSTTNDASIWSEELLNSIVGAEMVLGSDITNQLDEREAQMGPSEDNSGSLKSVMLIEGDNRSILSKGESQAEIIMCNSENPRFDTAIGGESNAQTHEVEREMGPMEFNSENLGGDMASKEAFVIETSDVEADSGCTLHDPGPLGNSSPETESVVDKIVSSGSMKTSNETEEVEKSIIEEKPTECNSKNVRCEVIIGCSNNTLDERKFHVGPTGLNSVNLGGEMVIKGGRNNELSEGEYYVGRTGKTLKSQIVTKGGRNGQSNERESHAGAIVDVSENLLDEKLVIRGTDDQSRLVDRQVGPDSPSCENLFGDAEVVTRGDINNKWNEGNCQVGPAIELKECIGTSKSSHLIQESAYDAHKVPQGERNTQEEEMTTPVSQSEECFEQIGPSELYRSVDEKNCTRSRLKFPFKETESELCGRVLSISPGFSLPETSVVKVDSKCALIDAGLLSSGLPATCLTNDKQVCAPTISNSSLDNNAPLCVATAPFLDSSSIAANTGVHQMENITKIKEAEKITTEEYCSADCGAHTPVELTTGGCSSPIELTEEPTFDAASVEKHDENKEALNESVLIHRNCKVENTASYKNLESNLDERIHPAVVEAVPESPAGIGNTEGLHDPSADAMTNGGLQTIQPIQANCSKSDSVKQTTEEILVTFENSISVREMPSPVTELVCQSNSLSEVIKEITATETIPDTELHGPRDCMRETMEILPVIQSVEVKAVDPLDRTIDEEVNVSDVSENSVMNDVTMVDIVRESSPVKLLSEPHGDASSDDCTQEIDNDRISLGCMQKKDDEETHDNVVYGIAKMLNAIVKNAGLTLSPVKISSEHHADAGTINSTLVQSDAVEQDADDCVLSVNPLMEKITEENSAVNDCTKLELSATIDDVGPRLSSVKTSFEFNRDISSIDGAPIQLEKKMEDGEFSGNILSEKSTEDNYKNTPTMENMELSFSPVKITPRSDMDASLIDHVLVTPEDEFKNVKVSVEDLEATNQTDNMVISFGKEMEIRRKSTSQEMAELVEGMKPDCESTPVDKQGEAYVGAISTDCALIQSDIAVSPSHIEGEDLEVTNQTDTTAISFGEEMETRNKLTSQEMAELVEGMRPGCESIPVDKQGGALVGAILPDCAPIQSGIAVSLSHIEGEDLEGNNQTDTTVISFGEDMGTRSELTSQDMAELADGMRLDCESTPVDKQGGFHVGAISIDCAPDQSDITVSLSHIKVEDLEAANQTVTTVVSFGEEMETRSKSTNQEMAELVEGMTPDWESTSIDKQGGAHVGAVSPDCAPIQSDIAVSLSHIEGEDLEGNNRTDTMVISFGKEMETRSELTSQDMAELAEGMRPECESTPVDKQGGDHVGAILTDCTPIESDIAVSLSHIEVEDLEAANRSVTTVISFGDEMETQSKSISQEMSDLVVAENKTAEVVGALLVIAEASSADKLSQTFGDDVSAPQLDDVLQCTLTESKDLKPSLLEFENGEKTCSSSKCSLPEENVTGVSLGDLFPIVKFDTMKEPQVKFIVSEKLTREDKNSFESPSACASGTVVVEKTEDLKKRSGVSGSNIHSPSTSKAVMSNEALNNTTCAEKNVKLPDLNMPQSATAPSQESMTEAQKMQLRAQIFVYGCLVDGSLPKEENMARSFEESERCIWEPLWHAYSEMLKNRSPLGSGKTPTLSGSRLKKTSRRTIQNDTSFNSPYFNWSPAPSNFQPFSWHFSPQSQAGQEPLQPTRVGVESEKPSRRRKRSSKDEVCYPGQNYVGRNANLIAPATNNVTPDFNVQTFPVPVSPVPIYATHSMKGKAGLVQAVSSTHGSIDQSRPTSEDLINRSAFLCAALPVFQLQSTLGYYQIAPPAPSCVFVDEASQQAKELSARPSETLHHSPGLQETVTTDKSSSTDPKDEVATAVAAAESVTKAAAAARLASEAARLASEAALQAQLLADEAMSLIDPNPGIEFEMVTPAKVLQSKDKVNGSHAIVSAMREASRRRVKLTSAASRRAENVDTILRAAEMAAEAVSQVGQVLMMGDPLPFSIADMVDTIGRDHLRAVQSGEADVSRREKVVDTGLATHDRTMVAQAGEALMRDPVPLSFGQRDLTGPGEDISVEIGGNVIKKGSYVEVTGEKEGLIGVWFAAIVLDLKDGMAHIRYTDLPSCKEEWVPVKMESGAAPMVRLAHSVTALQRDGNRKRRREDESSYSWSIGDHVDAWMRDGWWECIIAKKHDDEAKYTVHLPGKSLVVGEWDLRPSLVWKNGSWVEWVRVKESSEFSKGDSPLKKRQRVCSTPHDAEIVMPRPNPSTSTKIPKPLHQYRRESASSSSETNRKREESVSEPKRTGPRVCFGVPRPNKKTKFLEVTQVSRPRLANNSTLVPNSNGREKWQKPLTKISEPSKGPDGNLTKVRGKKPMTEPVTRKRVFSSTMLGGQTGTSHRKGVLNVGTGTSDRAGKTIAADAAPTEPRRSCRKVKPTSRLLEGLATDGLMSKIPGVGSIKGSVSLKAGSTRQ
ncbi:uncharacterized protein LOC144576342 isoform X3 [Carex rostrata]